MHRSGQYKNKEKETARLVSSNAGLSVYGASANFSTNIFFKQNMNERKAKIQLFMMEEENGFENLSLGHLVQWAWLASPVARSWVRFPEMANLPAVIWACTCAR